MAHYGPENNKIPGTEYERCVFGAILDSVNAQRHRFVGVQKAIEESRNEKANSDHKTAHTIAVGMLGLIHAVTENEKAEKSIRNLSKIANVIEDKLAIENKGDVE